MKSKASALKGRDIGGKAENPSTSRSKEAAGPPVTPVAFKAFHCALESNKDNTHSRMLYDSL